MAVPFGVVNPDDVLDEKLEIDSDYTYIQEKINGFIKDIMDNNPDTIPNSFEYGKQRDGKLLRSLIVSLKEELGLDKLNEDNIQVKQLVEKEIDENFEFRGLRILFINNQGKEIVKNISVTQNKDGNVVDFHMSMPKRFVGKNIEDLEVRNLENIKVPENIYSKRGIDLNVNINTSKEIAIEMIENHWGKFLLGGKDSVLQIFEEEAILKGTLDSTYSIGKDLEKYFSHFCSMNPELTLLKDSIKAEWLTEGKTIKASGNYIFNVGDEGNKTPVEGNFTFILKKVGGPNKWVFSVLHSSIKNNSYELSLLK